MAPPVPQKLRFLGLVGMIDPLREGAKEAVEACARAGIGVCMVTGDHPTTALAIARDLGIAQRPEQVVTGERFEEMSDEEIRAAVAAPVQGDTERSVATPVRVFARVAPKQKLRLVEQARDAGHFVAVTGDGANDAPALRAANIGVAMGRGGTDVARDASDLVISDDNFATIVRGVEQGRIAYDNIRKVIYLLLSTNGAEVFLAVAAVAIGLPLPLLPVQLLWLNLVTEGMQHVALAFEPGEGGVLNRPPRPPREPIFNQLMLSRLVVGSAVMGGVSLGAFWWMLERGWVVEEARNTLLLLLVLFENVQIGNSRSEMRSGLTLSPLRNPILLFAALFSLLVHVGAMHWGPLRDVLDTAPLELDTWLTLAPLALTVFVAMEIFKLIGRMRIGREKQIERQS
jgi:magnesium-transporting ATPase (P-type)